MMNIDVREELRPPLSILQKLDILERQLVFLKEKHGYTAAHSSDAVNKCLKPEEQCKSLSSALEEVYLKGTLMERVTLLENRVLQLSKDMELVNTSRSSSSSSAVAEKLGHGSGSAEASGIIEDMNMVITLQEKQDPLITQGSIAVEACSLNSATCRTQKRRIKAMSTMGYNRKWLKWLKLGC